MSTIRNLIRSLIPLSLLEKYRGQKKERRKAELEELRRSGRGLTSDQLKEQLNAMGIVAGDTLMIHCSLSKLGYVENGPKGLLNALLETIGEKGNLLMPSSPVDKLQLDFAKENRKIDLNSIRSAMGALSETFRKHNGAYRSTHPTEPVLAFGPEAKWLTEGHLGQPTPYSETSPYRRMMELNGKVLYVGVTLDNAGTHLHTLEDAVSFPYQVYFPDNFKFELVDTKGKVHNVQTKVHNPEWSIKRRCDELLPLFESDAGMKRTQLGQADCLLLNTSDMFNCMLKAFENKGVTMYHPEGTK